MQTIYTQEYSLKRVSFEILNFALKITTKIPEENIYKAPVNFNFLEEIWQRRMLIRHFSLRHQCKVQMEEVSQLADDTPKRDTYQSRPL